MRGAHSTWLIFSITLVFQLFMTTEAFWGRRTSRRTEVQVSDWGDWEETTLIESVEGDDDEDILKPDDGGGHGWLWRRQSGGAVPAQGAGNVGTTTGATANNLTGAPTTNTSGAAGNNTAGIVPGLIGTEPNPNRDTVNCSDVTSGRSERCWSELNLTDYVKNWQANTVCALGEGFASCYLRTNGYPGFDCTRISVGACTAPQNPLVYSDPRKFYVVYNIYAINAFFSSWWEAVGASAGIASNNIAKIIQIVDVPNNFPVVLQAVMIALQSVFALIPGPLGIYAAHGAFSFGYQTFAQVFSNAISIVPNVGRYLFPTGTADSQIVQLADLSRNFATVLIQIQQNLNRTVTSVMANATEFLAFAAQGNFSANAASLPDQANYLYFAFNTYLVSQALNGNNVYAVVGRDTNPKELASNGTTLAYDIKCSGYNELNICGPWWYSTLFKSAFTLNDFSHMNRDYGSRLNQLLSNLTTGPLLFEAAYQCNSAGIFGGNVNISVTTQGVQTACISQLRVLTWDMSCTPGDYNCEFLEQEAQNNFGFQNNYGVWGKPKFSVPFGYLGPAIAQNKIQLKRD